MKIINLVEDTKFGNCLNEHGLNMLYGLGVEPSSIHYDNFGG